MKKILILLTLTSLIEGCTSLDKKIVDTNQPLPPREYTSFFPDDLENRLNQLVDIAKIYDRPHKPSILVGTGYGMENLTNKSALQLKLDQAFVSAALQFGDVSDITFELNNNSANPVVLAGVIDSYDERVWMLGSTKRGDVSAKHSQDFLDVFFSKGGQVYRSNLGVTINAIDWKSKLFIPHVSTSISASLSLSEASGEYGLTVTGLGFDKQVTFLQQHGPQASAKLLVYFATAEAMSKLLQIPYWLVIPELRPSARIQKTLIVEYHCEFNDAKRHAVTDLLQRYTRIYNSSYDEMIGAGGMTWECPVQKKTTKTILSSNVPGAEPRLETPAPAEPQSNVKPSPSTTTAHSRNQPETPVQQNTVNSTVSVLRPKPKVVQASKSTPTRSDQSTGAGPSTHSIFGNWGTTDRPVVKRGPKTSEVFQQ